MTFRQVFTDGRNHPADPNPTWAGYSIGRWEGDTLVVRTKGFNGKTWLDDRGHPLGARAEVIERFSRRGVDVSLLAFASLYLAR